MPSYNVHSLSDIISSATAMELKLYWVPKFAHACIVIEMKPPAPSIISKEIYTTTITNCRSGFHTSYYEVYLIYHIHLCGIAFMMVYMYMYILDIYM